jgi:hypothetical protein
MRNLIGNRYPAGRSGKAVRLEANRMVNLYNTYAVDRRLLGIVLSTLNLHGVHEVQTYIPVSEMRFLLRYEDRRLSIGCYHFSVHSTRDILRWALETR